MKYIYQNNTIKQLEEGFRQETQETADAFNDAGKNISEGAEKLAVAPKEAMSAVWNAGKEAVKTTVGGVGKTLDAVTPDIKKAA